VRIARVQLSVVCGATRSSLEIFHKLLISEPPLSKENWAEDELMLPD
jgi:hypothetical protein